MLEVKENNLIKKNEIVFYLLKINGGETAEIPRVCILQSNTRRKVEKFGIYMPTLNVLQHETS